MGDKWIKEYNWQLLSVVQFVAEFLYQQGSQ